MKAVNQYGLPMNVICFEGNPVFGIAMERHTLERQGLSGADLDASVKSNIQQMIDMIKGLKQDSNRSVTVDQLAAEDKALQGLETAINMLETGNTPDLDVFVERIAALRRKANMMVGLM